MRDKDTSGSMDLYVMCHGKNIVDILQFDPDEFLFKVYEKQVSIKTELNQGLGASSSSTSIRSAALSLTRI